jgi:hypothetical protein
MNHDENDNQKRTVGVPFQPGDQRINRHGAPAFHAFRKQALEIANEKIPGPDGSEITRGEALLRSWLRSRQPKLQELFAFYCWGRPPERIELEELAPQTKLILRWPHEDPDSPHYRPPKAVLPATLRDLPPNVARAEQRRLEDAEAPQDISENS